MSGKARSLLLICLLILTLTGCWDYRGLNELTIVAGVAVDQGEGGQGVVLTFEILDLNAENAQQPGSLLLTTTGDTVAEAVYDAYAKLHGNLYFGGTEVVLVSRAMAEQAGIKPLMDFLIREEHVRDSLRMVIAATDTAAELLRPGEESGEEEHQLIFTVALNEGLSQHRRGTSHVKAAYEIRHILTTNTTNLALPIIAPNQADDRPFQLDGMALFTDGQMTGMLDQTDMPVYLLAATGLRGHAFPVEMDCPDGDTGRVILANRRSRPRLTFARAGDGLAFHLDISMTAHLAQLPPNWNTLDQAALRQIERTAGAELSRQVLELIDRQREAGYDIIGMAETVQSFAPHLWNESNPDWERLLQESEVTAQVRVRIQNTGMVSGQQGVRYGQ
ncbi:MAG: Ger(x)C family spore germination protein [Oscillospiraceae bacterium]|nr:Ger(x)C family spore germination protein [Oscillospiraceae bacterium]